MTTEAVGERSRMTPEERQIEMVEVLVGDEDAVDALGGQRERRRRDEPTLVRARPRVDDEGGRSGVDPEPGLAEPRQSRSLSLDRPSRSLRTSRCAMNSPMI